MQITVNIPDKLGKKFTKKFKPAERKKIINHVIEEKIKEEINLMNDSFFKWALEEKGKDKETKNDVSEKHDKYLYGEVE